MPGDPLKYVQPGQPMQLPAAAWNAFIDTTKAFRRQQQSQNGKPPTRPPLPPGHCYIKNGTEDDLGQFAVLGIGNALISPSDSPEAFAEQVAFSGVEPTTDHVGNGLFAILLEPAASEAVALACVAGATVCKINVSDADHLFADAADGVSAELASATRGPLRILWKQSGTGTGKWAAVRFVGISRGVEPVLVTVDGGTAGSDSTTCSFTYTVEDLDGNELATGKTPKRPRLANVEYETPAADSPGLAYYDATGGLQLYEVVEEIPMSEACEE